MKWNDESFVDLYDLLDVWPDAETGALRARISELYLEARDNLEHQSHRKRFYYRELYEVQLPLARLILLDETRRHDYDRELQQFWKQKGKPPTPHKPKDIARPKFDGLPGAASEPDSTPVDPFAEFADIEEDNLPPFQLPQPLLDKATVERRRDDKRRELIKHELVAIGFRWMLVGGLSVALLGVLIILILHLALSAGAPVLLGGAVLSLLAAIFAARQSNRWAKRRTVGMLSQMSYDELLRHSSGR